MDMNVGKEVAALKRMTVPQLREKYREVFGDETRVRHKAFLIKRIIWRLQALAEGDLSERAHRRADELANDADLRLGPPKTKPSANGSAAHTATASVRLSGDSRLPMPGAILTRDYKGETVEVMVLPKGFQYDGEVYRSLSAVAWATTGYTETQATILSLVVMATTAYMVIAGVTCWSGAWDATTSQAGPTMTS